MNLRTISDRYRALLQVNEVVITKSTAEELVWRHVYGLEKGTAL